MSDVRPERRRHKRQRLACPIRLSTEEGRVLARTRTMDISDGGLLLPLPDGTALAVGSRVRADFSVPRSTANTYLLEDFSSDAAVVRQQAPAIAHPCHIALQFHSALNLGLEP